MTTLNFGQMYADADPESDDRAPDGKYTFLVVASDYKEPSNGNPMFTFRAKIETPGPAQGKTAFGQAVITEKSQKMFFINMARYFGFNQGFWVANTDTDRVKAAMVGARFESTLGGREANGRTFDDFKDVKFISNPNIGAGTVPGVSAPPPPAAAVPAPPAPAAPAAPPAPAPAPEPAAPAAAVPAPPAPADAPAPPERPPF